MIVVPTRGQITSTVVFVMLSFSVYGCALFVPYVKPSEPRPEPSATKPVALWQAIKYADSTKAAYQSALRQYGAIPGAVAVPIIGMSAAALGLGITGTSGAAITALGLAGASSLGAATWYQNKPREGVYIAGYNAVTCLVESTKSVQLPSVVEEHLQLALFGDPKALQPLQRLGLLALRAKLAAQIRVVEASRTEVSNADQVLGEANKIYQDSDAITQAGLKLAINMSSVGQDLVGRVDEVIGLVNDALRQTEPNIQALATIVSGIGTSVTKGVGTTPPAPASPKTVPQKSGTSRAFQVGESPAEVLYEVEAAVAESSAQVSTIVTSLANVGAPDAPHCVALAKSAPPVLTLNPEGDIELAAGQQKRILVSSGQPAYAATLLTVPDNKDDLTVRSTSDNAVFYVELTASSSPKQNKTYVLAISDRTGATKSLKITIK